MSADSPSLAPGRAFGLRYRILRLLGEGGMGAVYQAWDQELGVAVALKVIRPEASASPDDTQDMERRFKRELLLARQVTHRNVVRIHDLGEIDGIKYITMPFIEGGDLSARLRHDGPLPVRAALAVARQIADGLAAAHEAGIVHRDLKPANIMVDAKGTALITDFGLARLSGPLAAAFLPQPSSGEAVTGSAPTGPARAPTTRSNALTAATVQQGAVVGTLEYMAPEQARGAATDHRADVYAFGMILQEMLVGRQPPPPGLDRVEALKARIAVLPTSLCEVSPDMPAGLAALVLRCLQLEPADRFQTSADLVRALNELDDDGRPRPRPRPKTGRLTLIGVGVLLIALTAVATWWLNRSVAPVQHPPVQVLMAKFENATNEPGLESTIEQSLGLALGGANFIERFSPATALKIATEQLQTAQGVDEERARLIAMSQGLDAVITGRVESRGAGYRLTVRTIDAQGKQLSVASADANGKPDILTAITRLASDLRDAFGDTTPASARQADMETFTTTSLDAMREYAQAQELANAGKYDEAIARYKAALALDSTFGRAQSGLAVMLFTRGRTDEAIEAYKRAFTQLGRMTERERLRTQGAYYLQVSINYEKAVENYSDLVKKYPFDRAGHSNLAIAYMGTADFRRAVEEGRLAVQLYPKDLKFKSNLALYEMYGGNFTEAADTGRKLIAIDPKAAKGYLPIAVGALIAGNADAARATYTQMAPADAPGPSLSASGLADLALYYGQYAEAERLLREAAVKDAGVSGYLAPKHAALAEALFAQSKTAEAKRFAILAGASNDLTAKVLGGLVLARLGASEAQKIAAELDTSLSPQPRACAKIVEAAIALQQGHATDAVGLLREAQKRNDLWLARLELGRTYIEANSPLDAVAELEAALKRRGEATSLFYSDWPTVRYVAPLHYWLARAYEEIGGASVAKARGEYEAYLAIRPAATKDALAIEAQRRLAALPK